MLESNTLSQEQDNTQIESYTCYDFDFDYGPFDDDKVDWRVLDSNILYIH